jgi:hypothetical protein
MKKITIIEISPLVCSLPGKENSTAEEGILRKLTRRFYHKSGSELRLEQSQKVKLLPMAFNN